jgi:hypothetical protein
MNFIRVYIYPVTEKIETYETGNSTYIIFSDLFYRV